MCSARVLLIDDDPLYVRRARRVFDDSVDLQVAASRGEVLDVTTSWYPDVIVVDMLLRDADAFAMLDELRSRGGGRQLSVVFLTKGPGAIQQFWSESDALLGVVKRESCIKVLRDAVISAISMLPAHVAVSA
jgi:CheY-like chemotaxis protein